MTWLSHDMKRDFASCKAEEVIRLMDKIMIYINRKLYASMDDIYRDLECDDIPMYVALHKLVQHNMLDGDSVYDPDHRGSGHNTYIYCLPGLEAV